MDLELKRRQLYQDRADNLKAMGFPSYDAYLDSGLWKSIRHRILFRCKQCFSCGRPSTQVHHTIYTMAVLKGQNFEGLYATCSSCPNQALNDEFIQWLCREDS